MPFLPPHVEAAVRARASEAGSRSFYLYDLQPMRAKIKGLKALLPEGVDIYYAMKANPHPAFLDAARSAGVAGIEIASLGEAGRALAAGFAAADLIFTGPGKSPEELTWSVSNRVRTIHIESLTEAHRLQAICAALGLTQDILVRVNPNFHVHGAQANFSGDPSKLGMDEAKFRASLAEILALPNLRFKGLHVYSASGVLEVASLLQNCELVFALARDVEAAHPGIECGTIDFGGGMGIDYSGADSSFDVAAYSAGLERLITQYGFAGRRFVVELGRYLAADSGWYCTEILDIKDSLGKKQVVCAGGSNHFRRPAALGINHPVVIVDMHRPQVFADQERVCDENVFIGGPLCNSADKLAAHDVHLTRAEIGDVAVFCLAGAYGYSMSHLDFLSHAHPPQIVI